MRVTKHWNMFPREDADLPCLEVFKIKMNGALSNLILWKVSLHVAQELELDDL